MFGIIDPSGTQIDLKDKIDIDCFNYCLERFGVKRSTPYGELLRLVATPEFKKCMEECRKRGGPPSGLGKAISTALRWVPWPCGTARLTASAVAFGPVEDDSVLASEGRILREANAELQKLFAKPRTVTTRCPPEQKCCITVKFDFRVVIAFRIKYTGPADTPVVGAVTATLNVRLTTRTQGEIGICCPLESPCPDAPPKDVSANINLDFTKGAVIDANKLEDMLPPR
jgi:hypothetical protein